MLLNRCPQKCFKPEQGEIQVVEIEHLIYAHIYVQLIPRDEKGPSFHLVCDTVDEDKQITLCLPNATWFVGALLFFGALFPGQ